MKNYILFFVIVIAAVNAKAQAAYNYQELGIGVGVSSMLGYTNIPKQYNNLGESVNLIYNFSPYVPIELELQKGTLSGGGLTKDKDLYGRKYTNNFLAAYLHADIQLGAIIDYGDDWFLNRIKNLYFGSGLGIILNNNKVQRTSVFPPTTYVFPGKDKSMNYSIPLRIGYEFKIFNSFDEPFMAVDIGYIHNIVLGGGLDGYDDPNGKFKNNGLNQYRQITFGLKYFFGNVVSFNKLVKP
ncbi:MAG: hypothetical protein ACXVB0_25470 [Mucilaginibacter sp.]